jgi:hypothetical protein
MSEEGGTSVSVGFFMSYADALRPFTFERAEESHEEDRFDPKTGKKVGTEKVVDVEGGTYVRLPVGLQAALGAFGPVQLGEVEEADEHDMGSPAEDGTEGFLEALGEILGCQVESFGGEYSMVGFNVALKGDYADDSYDPTSRMSAGPSIHLSKVMEMGDRVKALSKKMKALGFKDLGKPVVYNAFSVCY